MRMMLSLVLIVFEVAAAVPSNAVSASAYDTQAVSIIGVSSFVDSEGRFNLVGTVTNHEDIPIMVILGLNTVDSKGTSSALYETTYGRVISPFGESPFKFKIGSSLSVLGEPYIFNLTRAQSPSYNVLSLNYSNMAEGSGKALIGTARNISPFILYNVSIFASVHDQKGAQIDTVRSNYIPEFRPGQLKTFVAEPDPAIRSRTVYYSCAGVDLDTPITTLQLSNGKFIAYSLSAFASINGFKYDNLTNSIVFEIRHYNTDGGPASIMLPQFSKNQNVIVTLDGKVHQGTSIRQDGRTIFINIMLPKGEHHVQVQGITTVPEFPFTASFIGFAVMMGAAVFLAKRKES